MNRLSGISSLTVLAAIFVYNLSFAGWHEEVRISEPGNSGYPDIAVQGDTLHVVYTNEDNGDKISYVRSQDGGHQWSEHIVLSDTINCFNTLLPSFAVDGSHLMAIWKNTFIGEPRNKNIGHSISQDNGHTWSESEYVFQANLEYFLNLSACNSGPIVNIIYGDFADPDRRYSNVRSTDFGQSWFAPDELFRMTETSFSDMAAYDSTFIMAWEGNFDLDDPWDTYLVSSHDWGSSWSENQPWCRLTTAPLKCPLSPLMNRAISPSAGRISGIHPIGLPATSLFVTAMTMDRPGLMKLN